MNETDNTKPQPNASNDEIDLVEVALKIWKERKIIYKTVVIFFVLGLIVAFGSKKEYKAECTFILDDNQGGSRASGLLSQFGGLAGINLSGQEGQGMISPELFPNIVRSIPFMLELLNAEIEIEKLDTTVSVFTYFNELAPPSFLGYAKKFTVGLPGTILNALRKEDSKDSVTIKIEKHGIIRLSKKQEDIIANLNNKITINFEEKTGIIKLEVEIPDPLGAAQLVKITYNNLTKYLIDYKIDKARTDYNFLYERYLESKENYKKSQKKLAEYRDRNFNVSSATFKTDEENLQNEYQLAFNVYNGLAQQLEQAKIKVQEAMPVFKVVNEVKVPLGRSKPKRSLIMIVMIFVSGIVGVGWVILKMVWISVRKDVNRV